MTEFDLMWIPKDAPLPDGWREVPQRVCHHHYWSRLVERPAPKQNPAVCGDSPAGRCIGTVAASSSGTIADKVAGSNDDVSPPVCGYPKKKSRTQTPGTVAHRTGGPYGARQPRERSKAAR